MIKKLTRKYTFWREDVLSVKNDVKDKRERNSNIELLRIIAMLMIVIFHIVCHCVNIQLHGGDENINISSDLFNNPMFYKRLFFVTGIMKWGPIGNAIFMLISGYFMVEKGKDINIISITKKLLTQQGFAAVSLVLVSNMVVKCYTDVFISAQTFNFNGMSWFAGYYFVVIVCATLFLNDYLLRIGQKTYRVLLIIMFAWIQFSWSISILESIGGGLGTVILGLFLYSLGGYIKRYEPFKNVRVFVFGIIIICVNVIEYISSYNITQTAIESFDFNNPDAMFTQNILNFGNREIVIIAIAISLFEIFKRIIIPKSKIINFFGKGTFMVYLIHDNTFFYSLWGLKNWVLVLHDTPWLFLVDLVKWGGTTFIAGILMYVMYLLIGHFFAATKWIYIKSN